MHLIDASVFLEVELQQDRHRECEEFLEKVMEGSIRAVISDIEIDSILIVMEREKSQDMKKFLLSLSLSHTPSRCEAPCKTLMCVFLFWNR